MLNIFSPSVYQCITINIDCYIEVLTITSHWINLWKITAEWVKGFCDCHFNIADLKKISCETSDEQIRQLIVISVKEIIKKGKRSKKLEDLYQKYKPYNPQSTVKHIDTFDQKWESFIDIFRKDNDTQDSWYIL